MDLTKQKQMSKKENCDSVTRLELEGALNNFIWVANELGKIDGYIELDIMSGNDWDYYDQLVDYAHEVLRSLYKRFKVNRLTAEAIKKDFQQFIKERKE
jgi:hypothetical protein